MRVGILLSMAILASCASCASCPRPVAGLGAPWVEDQASGIPKMLVETSQGLLDVDQRRRCQVVFEPAFSNPHAVWLVQDDAAADATVFVRVHATDSFQSFSAVLDRNTALRLSQLCLSALTADVPACERHGVDGVWYHAAHPRAAHSYAMASFWTPRRGTIANAFVKVAEALRSYATAPESLRAQEWIRLQESKDELSKRLTEAGAG